MRACVRACEAAWARDASAVAGVGQMQVPGGVRPSLPPAGPGPAYYFGCGWGVGLLDRVGKCLEVFESV